MTSVKGLLEKALGLSGRLSTGGDSTFTNVRISTVEDGTVWTGDFSLEKERNKLLTIAKITQKALYIYKEDTAALIGKVHVQLSLFEEEV